MKSSLHQCQQDRTLETKKALGTNSKLRTKVTLRALKEVMLTVLKMISKWLHGTVQHSAAVWVYNLASSSITSRFINKHLKFWFSSHVLGPPYLLYFTRNICPLRVSFPHSLICNASGQSASWVLFNCPSEFKCVVINDVQRFCQCIFLVHW